MKLDHDVRIKQDVLKKLNNELKNKIKQRQKEIDQSKELYDLKSQQLKINQNQRESEIRENFNRNILEANQEKQRKLEHYQTSLQRDKELMDRERENLTVRNESQMKNMLRDFKETYRTRFQDSHLMAQKIHDDTQNVLDNMKTNTRFEIQESNRSAKKESDAVVRRNENILEKQKEDYSTLLHQTQIENAANLAKERMRFEKEMRRIYSLQAGEASVQESTHAKQLAKKEEFYNHMILQKEKGFKDKLSKLIQAQNKVLQNVRDKFQVEVDKVKTELSKTKNTVSTKGKDEFYQVRTLEPQLHDKGKFYLLSLDVPEHEKEGFTFNATNRELRINFQRSFADDVMDEKGNVSKSKRNELYTKIVKTGDILDPNGIRTSYDKKLGKLNVQLNKA